MSTVASPQSAGKSAAARPTFKVRAFDLLADGKREEAQALVDLGRKEIHLAEEEMPGLMTLRSDLANSSPWLVSRSWVRCT